MSTTKSFEDVYRIQTARIKELESALKAKDEKVGSIVAFVRAIADGAGSEQSQSTQLVLIRTAAQRAIDALSTPPKPDEVEG